MKKIAINGLGRIGRLVLRHYLSDPPENVEIAAANDLTPTDELAYLLRYDSVHGNALFSIQSGSDYLKLGSQKVGVLNEKDPGSLPWNTLLCWSVPGFSEGGKTRQNTLMQGHQR